jgi:hypothetical protein
MREREARRILHAWGRGEAAPLPAEREAKASSQEFPCPLTSRQMRELRDITALRCHRPGRAAIDPFDLPPY